MKSIKLIGCLVAIAAIVGVNVWNATTSVQNSDLSIADIEAVAQLPGNEYWLPNDPSAKVGTEWGVGPNASVSVIEGNICIQEECMLTISTPEIGCKPVGSKRWVPIAH